MPFLPEETRREIRERTNLVELIGETVALRKAGATWKGLCPFHPEKTPSFTVNEARGFFHCFGCNVGGDAFEFVMRREGVSFPEAARALARRAGVRLPADDLSPEARRAEAERAALFAANAAAAAFFASRLASPEGRAAREYLTGRGIEPATALGFGLGLAPAGWDGLVRHLAAQGHGPEVVARAGLAVPRKEGGGYYDRFRDRLVIPIADPQGRLVAFGGRAVAKDQEPKYLNSAESPLYRKGEVLFGLAQAREAIRRGDQVIVVEGYFDCIALHQAGLRETVATCGTALTSQHVGLLGRYARRVVTLFDGDEAGMRAAERSLGLFLEAEISARVVELPKGEDPDTFVRARGAEALRMRIAAAPSLLEALIEARARAEDARTVEGQVRTLRAVAPIVGRVRDRLYRDLLAKRLAERLGVDEEFVRRHVTPRREAAPRETRPAPSAGPVPGPADEGRQKAGDCLIRAVLCVPELASSLLASSTLDDLGDPDVRAVVGAVSGLAREAGVGAVAADRVSATLPEGSARARLARVAVGLDAHADEARARRECEDAVRWIREKWIDEELTRLARELSGREGAPADELAPLLARVSALASEKKGATPHAS